MTILFCTDEELMLTTLEFRFRKQGWKLDVLQKASSLESIVKTTGPDIALVDLQMPAEQGLSIIKQLKNGVNPSMPVLVLSYLEDEELLNQALQLDVDDFITKPIKPDEIALRIKRIIAKNSHD